MYKKFVNGTYEEYKKSAEEVKKTRYQGVL
jgi:hypothetical protein